ncbi:M23 family metallopeptidase [Bacillus sp. FJAT-50079]|uniref:M23 family metallopeptidase n=1 Tax=Bacillus sp. FJAT-50079 TaxID=2833577 RepID=UPI001BC91BEF|nr:M23 family metallopeptidase [Bacillus sp. FJAT-50079]MBS4208965.1 M23 family metallopeptidase [Bacillus sp. FJAT-50079]
MNERANEIRKRLAKRRKQYPVYRDARVSNISDAYDYEHDVDQAIFQSEPDTSFHPLWNRNVFILKILMSAALVLIAAIIYESPSPTLDKARTAITTTMKKEFQFAAVSHWYEGTFGKPLALFPTSNQEQVALDSKEMSYSLPVSGKILEGFSDDHQGIIIETGSDAEVEAMTEGTVIFAGKQADTGNTVIVQHPDQTKSWYGKMDEIVVKPYEKVSAGKVLGTVSSDDGGKGQFYFAIKQEDQFIDPIQVMSFE